MSLASPMNVPSAPPGSKPAEANRPTPDPDLAGVLGLANGPPKRHRLRNTLVAVAVLGLVGLGIARWAQPGGGGPALDTVKVRRADLRATVTATGRLQGLNTVEVGAEVSGKVIRVLADFNDRVTKGQVLAEIDPEQPRAAVAEAEAQLAAAEASILQAQATVEEASQTRKRVTAQAAQGLVSQREIEAATAAAARAAASLASAKANATLAQASSTSARSRLKKTTIVAPQDGIVLARSVEPGQTVNAGFQTPVLFKLAGDLRQMRLYVDIDEADIGQVREGQEASFTVDAYPDRSFPSALIQLRNEPTISQNVVTYEGVLAVENDQSLLRPGMTATATIVTQAVKDVLVVPNAALRFSPPRVQGPFQHGPRPETEPLPPGSQRLWVTEDGRLVPVTVKVGVSDGQDTELRDNGLAEGAEVVLNLREKE